MPDRIQCLVPFCRRTTPRVWRGMPIIEWICPRHWRGVTAALRRRYARARRRALRGSAEADGRAQTIWIHCREQAISRGGLA